MRLCINQKQDGDKKAEKSCFPRTTPTFDEREEVCCKDSFQKDRTSVCEV